MHYVDYIIYVASITLPLLILYLFHKYKNINNTIISIQENTINSLEESIVKLTECCEKLVAENIKLKSEK